MTEFPWDNVTGWLSGEDGRAGDGWVSDHALQVRRHRLETAREWLVSGGSVLFFGPPAAGKSAALDVVTASALGWRVLQRRPGRPSGPAPYAGLRALLSAVTGAELAAAGALQRDIVQRVVEGGGDAHPGAVRWATLDVIRLLGRSGPVLLVVDEVENLDEESGEVLRSVARQVEELPVRVAAAECVTGQLVLVGRRLCPAPLLAVQLDGLDPPAASGPSVEASQAREAGQPVPWWRRRGGGGPA